MSRAPCLCFVLLFFGSVLIVPAQFGGRRRYLPGSGETSIPNLQELEQLEAFWDLPGHKKPALLIQDMIMEYKPFLWRIRPQVRDLVRNFRAAGLPIFWSEWWRLSPQVLKRMGLPEDWSKNHSNELDRLFGPLGIKEGDNGNFIYEDRGWETLSEIAPVNEEERRRVQRKWRMNCFAPCEWQVNAGQQDLASEMRKINVDLVVNVGVWTDACIVATAFGSMNEDLDLVTVSDAVDTVTTAHQQSLYVIQGAAGKVSDTATVISYIQKSFLKGSPPHLVLGETLASMPDSSGRRRYLPGSGETSMPNLQELEQLEAFWDLPGHTKPALLIQDMILEYKPFLWRIRPQVRELVRSFRAAGLPIFWSEWWRLSPQVLKHMGLPEDWAKNHSNELDRLFGPLGIKEGDNGNFIYEDHGWETLSEIAPVNEEERRRVQRKWRMDCFAPCEWQVNAGQQDLASEMRNLDVDLVVNVGVWTDACIVATAFGAMNKDLDLVTVSDAVDTVTTAHQQALYVIQGAAGKVSDTATVIGYIQNSFLKVTDPKLSLVIEPTSSTSSGIPPTLKVLNISRHELLFQVCWTLLCLLIGFVLGRWKMPSFTQKQLESLLAK